MLLRATGDLLRVTTSASGQVECHVSAVETDAATPPVVQDLPRTNTANITTATTTTILDCTTASRRRRVIYVSIANTASSGANNITVQHTDGTTVREVFRCSLLPGESAQYNAAGTWMHLDSNGAVYGATTGQQFPSVLMPPHYASANLTSTKTLTSGSAFAVYVGKATRSVSSVIVRNHVTTAAATITWAEVAIARGAINVGGNQTLTVLGFADVAAIFNTTGRKSTTVNVSASQQINAGDDLWVLIGNAATTAAVVRAQSVADDLQVGLQAALASRPSTTVGVGTVYTLEGATTLAPWVALVL